MNAEGIIERSASDYYSASVILRKRVGDIELASSTAR